MSHEPKRRIFNICHAPLWRILRDAKRDETGSKILNVQRYIETGRPMIRRGWTYNHQLTHEVGCRLVKYSPVPIDRFNGLIIRFERRYNSRSNASVMGCLAVTKDKLRGYSASNAFIGNSYYPIDTSDIREKTRKKLRKKITEAEAESLVMLAEFSYISELSKKEEIRWNTK